MKNITQLYETKTYKTWAPVVARIFIGALFTIAGIGKIFGFAGVVAFVTSFNVPFPATAVVLAILIEVGGGLLLLFGIWTRLVAFKLALFVLIITLIFHTNFADQQQLIQFLKNFAIIGGLLLLSVQGATKMAAHACPIEDK